MGLFQDSQRLWIINVQNPHAGDISSPNRKIAPEITPEPPSNCRRIGAGVVKAALSCGFFPAIDARKDPKSLPRYRKVPHLRPLGTPDRGLIRPCAGR